ncbi:hypothetical protein CTAM01_05724 [Colletotrichum tamarilloi]|uniref:Uncharacterized protein n=1 Tax=Colletotrichum tamarilloi TaxID=1209934 RepID=A0ABQ9RDC5_9PEZI|nr:uncharacterized protein CTAM01_05724 [Colletotrichum tamarilloi]KAK1501500.1 hypothetical protein CTAM01_05724 [Colletotrichum tamarilloi]
MQGPWGHAAVHEPVQVPTHQILRAEPGLRLPRRSQHAPLPPGSTVAHDSILSLLREYDPARPGPPSCRPCIAHAPLKKPVHNPPGPEQELPVNNAVGRLLFCCHTKSKYPGFLRDYVLGPQSRKFKPTSLAPSPSNFPWTPATLSGRPSVRASHHASEPSQANIAASFPPKSTIHPVPSSPALVHSLLLLNLVLPPARTRDRRRLPRASPCLVLPLRQTRSDRADRLDDSTTAGNFLIPLSSATAHLLATDRNCKLGSNWISFDSTSTAPNYPNCGREQSLKVLSSTVASSTRQLFGH